MGRSALLVIDMFNDYCFEHGDVLLENARAAVPRIRELIDRVEGEDTLLLYVNDNYGDWNASRDDLVRKALDGKGGDVLEAIVPPDDAVLVHKARHSVFYGTPIEYLLFQEGVDRLILTGQVTEQCILYSALDGYVRHYELAVPSDAVAGIHDDLSDAALKMMQTNMDADVEPASDLALSAD
jgi:nicotinamidase-related amidase